MLRDQPDRDLSTLKGADLFKAALKASFSGLQAITPADCICICTQPPPLSIPKCLSLLLSHDWCDCTVIASDTVRVEWSSMHTVPRRGTSSCGTCGGRATRCPYRRYAMQCNAMPACRHSRWLRPLPADTNYSFCCPLHHCVGSTAVQCVTVEYGVSCSAPWPRRCGRCCSWTRSVSRPPLWRTPCVCLALTDVCACVNETGAAAHSMVCLVESR